MISIGKKYFIDIWMLLEKNNSGSRWWSVVSCQLPIHIKVVALFLIELIAICL
jgi:hypothetical protein